MRRMILILILTGIGCVAMASPAPASVVAYYKFEPGNLTLDSSGNGHTLTNTNVVSSASVPLTSNAPTAGSASFNGSNAFFLSNVLSLNGQTAITVEWFMKVTTGTTGVQLPFEQSGNGNLSTTGPTAQRGPFTSVLDNGSTLADLDLVHFSANSNDHEHFAANLTSWHHYAMVMQQVATPTTIASTAIKLQLYIDGVLQTATSTPGASQEQAKFADDVLYIGARGDGNANGVANDPSLFYNGLIDELRISTGALSPAEFLVPEPSAVAVAVAALGLRWVSRRRRCV